MEFVSKNKKMLIGILIILFLLIIMFMFKSETKEYFLEEDNLMGFFLEDESSEEGYTKTDTLPTSGYVLNSLESYCRIDSEKVEGTIKYDLSTKSFSITPFPSGEVKCYLYFDKDEAKAREYILAQNTVNEDTPDFSTVATTNEGIFKAEDDEGTSYYYRGAVDNNYFYFGGYYWRIVRINGDGTVRLIYQGKSANSTGTSAQLADTSAWNSTYNDNTYVGYMYGTASSSTYAATHTNTNSSTIKGVLDTWYTSNLASYSEYIADSGFCGDRSLTSGTGIGTALTYYGAYGRIVNSKAPSLKCVNNNDLYTTSSSSKGNKALTYPVGLITADEVAYAGGVSTGASGTANKNYYLYTGSNYRTMTPYGYDANNGTYYASVYGVDTSGVVRRFYSTTGSQGVRPVININKDVDLEGTGTASDPYKIVGIKEPEVQTETIQEIIASKTVSTRSDFSTVLTSDTTGTIYSATDDDGTTYYFAGAPTDNYVYFANYYWRIIRVNGDGSIRLIYDGTSAIANGTSSSNTQISTSAFNSSYINNMYVGFMYTSGSVHGLGTSSTIKGVLDTWYTNNLASYGEFLDTNAGFCGDRYPSTSSSSSNGSGGTSKTTTYYAAYIRLVTNKAPSYKCQTSTDLYTVSSSSKGNKALTNPIGLISADEVAYAGGVYGTNNKSYYLYTGNDYWTMSPYYWEYSGGLYYSYVFDVLSIGSLTNQNGGVTTADGVRPVINLKANTTFSGSGTASDPYKVEGAS